MLSASPGGRIERKKSAPESNAFSSAAGFIPAARARSALAALRPDSNVRTSAPLSCRRLPTPDPILPCATITTTMFITDLIPECDYRQPTERRACPQRQRNPSSGHPLPLGIHSGVASEPRTRNEQSNPAQASLGDADPGPQGRRETRLSDGLYGVGRAASRCA